MSDPVTSAQTEVNKAWEEIVSSWECGNEVPTDYPKDILIQVLNKKLPKKLPDPELKEILETMIDTRKEAL